MVIDSFLQDVRSLLLSEKERLAPLVNNLKSTNFRDEKYDVISLDEKLVEFLQNPSSIKKIMENLSKEDAFIIKSIIVIDQQDQLLDQKNLSDDAFQERFEDLIRYLHTVEDFYSEIGGIIGYHYSMLCLLCQLEVSTSSEQVYYHSPDMIDISMEIDSVHDAIFYSIEKMSSIAEIYPVGGAADRLNLVDPSSGQPLPAAELMFCGKTLLERLVVDVQVKEYLYYKLKGDQLCIPIAMMTSTEKDNHRRILQLCEKHKYFNRPKESFFFFCQPLVPTINIEGKWGMKGTMQPLLRPGGHGVIWKLARDSGCFNWMKQQNVQKILVRQINNPIAAEDYGLYAFSGIGLKNDLTIGFCSCPRVVKSAEGTNVLVEKENNLQKTYTLTNIEYCDFQKYGISDEPINAESNYSKFPSNTNLLFLDLGKLQEALKETPIPGMLINLKKISFLDDEGARKEQLLARLESMMQNIADSFSEDHLVYKGEMKGAYITFNHRSKTISTTKKEYVLGASLLETPEGCYVDMMKNAKELLHRCGVVLHENEGDFHRNFSFLYHPALGPMYSIISQKIRGGEIFAGSELELDIADIDFSDFTLKGSLRVSAENIMGHIHDKKLHYSNNTGKCTLKNVSVLNRGIDYEQGYIPWKSEIKRKESCQIQILGNGEFYAENVVLKGNIAVVVKDGTRVVAVQTETGVDFLEEPINQGSWFWCFYFNCNKRIVLERISK
ncbi:MAG: hypothetical protein FJZ57_01390 [Chlamydiae bacterium]|nr:hypothetical protein [Chlamydiota bacterium]